MYFNEEVNQVLQKLSTSDSGLTATLAQKRLTQNGNNELKEQKRKSFLNVFLSQFTDFLVIILIIAALISFMSGNKESTYVILFVIICNALLGTIQHFKAEKSLDALKKMSAPNALVFRDKIAIKIPSSQLVVGDIVLLEAGDIVPADARIIEDFSLKIDESALTGESLSVLKNSKAVLPENTTLADRVNMVYSSSMVTYGRAKCVITATGMDTEIGKIASLLNKTKERKTPLQKNLDNFSKKLSLLIIFMCAVIFSMNIYRGTQMIDSLMFAVSLAVAAIPEALSSIVTITLAIGTTKMTRENAIVKNLNAVESLGAVSIICSDKTGTLTQNKMTVKETFSFTKLENLLKIAVLCNDTKQNEEVLLGDPTETCLVSYFNKNGGNYKEIHNKYPRIYEIPFDSDRKLMSTVHNFDGLNTMYVKGAIDVMQTRITNVLVDDTIRPITEQDIKKINEFNHKMAENGLRVLAFAKKIINTSEITLQDENDLVFVGLAAIIDPPRKESKQAVLDCKNASIMPIMITGDHEKTATAIAKEIGIFTDGDITLTGAKLDLLSDEELMKILSKVSVYARVSPEHKIRIVDLWQKCGEIVAMTGDGVNDAPALKKADIGIAMGITGTEVSKDASSVVLTDDNFATIIKAIKNGRNIYKNIVNAIKFLLSGNTSGIIAVAYATFFALPMPFSAVHLLFINLLTDSMPAIAISMENTTDDLLKEKPRKLNQSILSKHFLKDTFVYGGIIAIFTLIAFYMGLKTNTVVASTMAFSTLSLARIFHVYNCRTKKSFKQLSIFSNKYVVYSTISGVLLVVLTLIVPFLQNIFEVEPLTLNQFICVFLLALSPTLLIQIKRLIKIK